MGAGPVTGRMRHDGLGWNAAVRATGRSFNAGSSRRLDKAGKAGKGGQ